MAWFKDATKLHQSNGGAYDSTHAPGTIVPFSGIYRCDGCGREAACNVGDPLPPQNHHQHPLQAGPVRWRLLVYADHEAKTA